MLLYGCVCAVRHWLERPMVHYQVASDGSNLLILVAHAIDLGLGQSIATVCATVLTHGCERLCSSSSSSRRKAVAKPP